MQKRDNVLMAIGDILLDINNIQYFLTFCPELHNQESMDIVRKRIDRDLEIISRNIYTSELLQERDNL